MGVIDSIPGLLRQGIFLGANDVRSVMMAGSQLEVSGVFGELTAYLHGLLIGEKKIHGSNISRSAINNFHCTSGRRGNISTVEPFDVVEYFFRADPTLGFYFHASQFAVK